MLIYKTLLRYGYSNFTIEILEYCDSEKCIEREQYYIDLLKPEYNILKRAGSSLGFKHTEETLAKISAANKGEKHPMYGKTHTEETLAKITAFRKGKKHSEETLVKMAAAKKDEKNPMFGKVRPVGSGRPSQRIEILNLLTNERTEYESISAAALALNIKKTIISTYFRNSQKKPLKKIFIFKKIENV